MRTLENTQVYVTNLTPEEIKSLCIGVKVWLHESALHKGKDYDYFTKFKSDDDYYIRSFDPKKEVVSLYEFNNLKSIK